MYDYYFLFGLGLIWLCFAVVQDLRTREISNWLNFSLLGFALLYRGFVSISRADASFFWWGVGGTFFFMALAYILYYAHGFAGGDAKLLMALGPIMPFERLNDLMVIGLGFVLVLFVCGSLYSLLYTAAYVPRRWMLFKRTFKNIFSTSRKLLWICFGLGLAAGFLIGLLDPLAGILFFIAFALLPLLYIYGKTLERCFFIKKMSPQQLTEGDWLVHDVSIGKTIIHADVHGLTLRDIALLRKAKKQVMIKEGIPFSPAFFFAFLFMVFYVLR